MTTSDGILITVGDFNMFSYLFFLSKWFHLVHCWPVQVRGLLETLFHNLAIDLFFTTSLTAVNLARIQPYDVDKVF